MAQLGHTIVRKYLGGRVSVDPTSEGKDMLTKVARPQLLSDGHLGGKLSTGFKLRAPDVLLNTQWNRVLCFCFLQLAVRCLCWSNPPGLVAASARCLQKVIAGRKVGPAMRLASFWKGL